MNDGDPPLPPLLFRLEAIRGCPTSWWYWSDLGWCYHTEGKQAAALKAYTRAEELLADEDEDEDGDGDGNEDGDGGHAKDDGGHAVRAKSVELKLELAARVRVRTQVGQFFSTYSKVCCGLLP